MDLFVHNPVLLKILLNFCVVVGIGTTYLLTLSTRWKWSLLSWVAFLLGIGLILTTGTISRATRDLLKKNLQNEKSIEQRDCFYPGNSKGLLYRVRGTGLGEGVVCDRSPRPYSEFIGDSQPGFEGQIPWLLTL